MILHKAPYVVYSAHFTKRRGNRVRTWDRDKAVRLAVRYGGVAILRTSAHLLIDARRHLDSAKIGRAA